MAKALTPQDCYALMNELVQEATGQKNVTAVDLSTFVSAGETVLATGMENTLNALSMVLGRTIIAVRPYRAKYSSIQAIDSGEYTSRLRKISFFSKNALPEGAWNTQLYPENLYQGKTNAQDTTSGHESTKSQWVQNQAVPFEMHFGGSDVWSDSITVYENQLKKAFRDPAVFADFAAGIMTEKGNDIESQKEAFGRVTVLNKIGSVYLNGSAAQKVNLTYEFNQEFGTSYTSAQLRSTYLKEFLAFLVARIKLDSDRLTERTCLYHEDFTKSVANAETGVSETLHILRHTPKEDQHLMLFNPLYVKAQSYVLPAIFNDQYLKIENFEAVEYWQSNYSDSVRPQVKVYPAVYDSTTGAQVKGDLVELPYVVGLMFDRDAMMIDFQLDDALSTTVEARKRFRNLWWHFSKLAINDPSENCILYTMEDPAEGNNLVGSAIVGTAEAGD